MKNNISAAVKKFSSAILKPIMFLSVVGIVIAVSVLLNRVPGVIGEIGGFVYKLMLRAVINNLSIIFCVGIATALARRKKGDAAVVATAMYLIFLYANNLWLSGHGMLAEAGPSGLSGTGQASVFGLQVVDMGVFLGIVLGCLTGYLFNKLEGVEFPDVVRVYGGSRFAFTVSALATTVFAILMCYVWPVINSGISALTSFIESTGMVGLFVYGFLNRFLIPTGMHHLVYMPFVYTPVGGTLEIAGVVTSGAKTIALAELANAESITVMHESVKYMLFGFSKIFGVIGITMAFIKTAKPEKKAQTRSMLIPMAAVALLAGITEPFEFAFLFVAPGLWLAHSILDGLFQVILFSLGCRFPFSSGLLSNSTYLVLPAKVTKWYILLLVGIVAIFVWYFVFTFMIKKFDYKTPGREDDDAAALPAESTKAAVPEGQKNVLGDVNFIIAGLGGAKNIDTVTNCFTRLRVDVKDLSKLDEASINKFPNSGIVKKGNNVQVIIGMKVQSVREDVCTILGIE